MIKHIHVLAILTLIAPRINAADTDYLYGAGDMPNRAQRHNRHFTLLEHVMIDNMVLHYATDESAKKVLDEHQAIMASIKNQEDALKKANWRKHHPEWTSSEDPVQMQWGPIKLSALEMARIDFSRSRQFADEQRKGAWKEMAMEYLRASKNGDPLKLSAQESELLNSYHKYAPSAHFVNFKNEWLDTIEAVSPEERYKLAERVARFRAFLRSEMKHYVDSPPAGVHVDPAAQYAQLAARSRLVFESDPTAMSAVYADAGITPPAKPQPRPAPNADSSKAPFVYRFSDQEHALLTLTTALDPKKLEQFEADRDRADANPAAATALVEKWRQEALSGATTYLKTPIDKSDATQASMFHLGWMEYAYLKQRVKRMGGAASQQLERLSLEAQKAALAAQKARDEAAKGHMTPVQAEHVGDADAGARFGEALRKVIRADLETYAKSKGGSQDAALTSWAEKNLKPETTLAQIAPKPAEAKPMAITLPQALERLYANPTERALVEFIVKHEENAGTACDRLIEASNHPEQAEDSRLIAQRREEARALASLHISKPIFLLSEFLSAKTIDREQILAYYCPNHESALPAAKKTFAFEQLKTLASRLSLTQTQNQLEEASTAASFEPLSSVELACREWKKAQALQAANRPTLKPDLKSGDVPSPTAAEKTDRDLADTIGRGTAGGIVGAAAGAVIAAAIGFGPLGFIATTLAVAVIGLGLAVKK